MGYKHGKNIENPRSIFLDVAHFSVNFAWYSFSLTYTLKYEIHNCFIKTAKTFFSPLCKTPDSMSVFRSCFLVVFADNNSEDEGASVAKAVKTEPAEVASEPEEKTGGMEAYSDEADGEELDGEDSQQAEGVDPSSKVEGGQMASMSTRSESKPYSSVTHKCEVRNIDMSAERSK